jgi:superfamily II DNA helicase RecQ
MYTSLCSKNCSCSNGPIAGASCIALERLQSVLLHVFGYADFRPGQLQAMLPALHGNDAIVRMATGAGKSLCMYLPLAHSDQGIEVIISPLNALMDEQVQSSTPHVNVKVFKGSFWP